MITVEDIEIFEQALEAKKDGLNNKSIMSGTMLLLFCQDKEGAEKRRMELQQAHRECVVELERKTIPVHAKLIESRSQKVPREHLKTTLTKDDIDVICDCLDAWANRHTSNELSSKITTTIFKKMSGASQEDMEADLDSNDVSQEVINNEKDKSVLLKAKLYEFRNTL